MKKFELNDIVMVTYKNVQINNVKYDEIIVIGKITSFDSHNDYIFYIDAFFDGEYTNFAVVTNKSFSYVPEYGTVEYPDEDQIFEYALKNN